MSRVEQVTRPIARLGECPVWDPASQTMRWVDLRAGDLISLDLASGGLSRLHIDTVVSAFRPRRSGGLVVAIERGFALLDGDLATQHVVADVLTDPTLRMNDGACDPRGRFYCGSMAYDHAAERGTLHRLEPDLSVHVVLAGVTVSNGIAWNRDGSRVYYVDSPTQRIDMFDYELGTGAFSGRRTLANIDPSLGMPDGLSVDADGGVWVALWNGGAIHRYAPDGRLDQVVDIPTSNVTACAFGGTDLADLFITTARVDVPDADPRAGALFRYRPGVHGLPPHAFAG